MVATLESRFLQVESLDVWSIIQAAGWPIWPLIFASVIALALIFERLWSLRQSVFESRKLGRYRLLRRIGLGDCDRKSRTNRTVVLCCAS